MALYASKREREESMLHPIAERLRTTTRVQCWLPSPPSPRRQVARLTCPRLNLQQPTQHVSLKQSEELKALRARTYRTSQANVEEMEKVRIARKALMEERANVISEESQEEKRMMKRIKKYKERLKSLKKEREEETTKLNLQIQETMKAQKKAELKQHQFIIAEMKKRKVLQQELETVKMKVDELQQLLEEANENYLCIICRDRPRNTFVVPCLHFHFCSSCITQHINRSGLTCPTCRGTIQWLVEKVDGTKTGVSKKLWWLVKMGPNMHPFAVATGKEASNFGLVYNFFVVYVG